MKTLKLDFKRLRNEEHFQFHSEVVGLVNRFGAQTLNIEQDFPTYFKLVGDEEEALLQIRKSVVSDQLSEADNKRDILYKGMSDLVKSALNHFNPVLQDSAAKVMLVLNQYGNVARKSHNDETAAIYKLVKELNEHHADEVQHLKLAEWLTELTARNNAFDLLMQSRFSEDAERTTLRMKAVRNEVDGLFRTIALRIDALITLNDPAVNPTFVRELNVRIEHYTVSLAIRKGKGHKPEWPETN